MQRIHMLLQGHLLRVGLPANFAHEPRDAIAFVLRVPVQVGFVLVGLVAFHALELFVRHHMTAS